MKTDAFLSYNACVCFFASLAPTGKNLDSKLTVYFEWPSTFSHHTLPKNLHIVLEKIDVARLF